MMMAGPTLSRSRIPAFCILVSWAGELLRLGTVDAKYVSNIGSPMRPVWKSSVWLGTCGVF